jgi:GT2 family glycosyltransferase
MRRLGLLWDSVTANIGDQAIGLLLQRACERAGLPYTVVDPFGTSDLKDIATLMIGGGELLRAPGNPFYDVFRVPGRHILNTVGVLDGSRSDYLNEYRMVSVRSQADRARLGQGEVSACLTLLFGDYLPSHDQDDEIPAGALGLHVTAATLGQVEGWFERLRAPEIGPVVWLSLTPYNADAELMRVLAEQVPGSVVAEPASPDEAFRTIGRLRGLLSASLHGTLFAYSQRIPFFSFTGDEKLRAFLEERKMQERGYASLDSLLEDLPARLEQKGDFDENLEQDRQVCRATLQRILTHCREALEEDADAKGPRLWASRPYHELETRFYRQQGELAGRYLRERFAALEAQSERHAAELESLSREQQVDLKEIYEQLGTGLYESRRELHRVYSTHAWRVVRLWWRVKDKFFPPGSRRLELYESLRSGLLRQNVLEHKVHDPAYARLLRRSLPRPKDLHAQRREIERGGGWPSVALVTIVEDGSQARLRETMRSLRAQSNPFWSWVFVDATGSPEASAELAAIAGEDGRIHLLPGDADAPPSANWNLGVEHSAGGYLSLLPAGDQLTPDALYNAVRHLRGDPGCEVVYSDYDHLDHQGILRQPRFKPDWSPETMLSVNLLDHLCVFERGLWQAVGGMDRSLVQEGFWDLALRIAGQAERVVHVPRVLYHARVDDPTMAWGAGFDREQRAARREVLLKELKRRGLKGVRVEETVFQTLQVMWTPDPPRPISIIIPSRDRVELLERCLISIFERTSYDNFEVVLVDTGSEDSRTWDLYARFEARAPFKVVELKEPFNFSAACNLGARHASGELLLFLNNDTEVQHEDWLQRMVQWFELEGVGAVGAKLLYPDRRIQHAGVVVGLGGMASHLFQNEYEPVASIFGSDTWYRNLSAVTAACLMIDRAVFESVGGFDEDFQLNYSDVDLCLKLRREGWRIVYTPDARLFHAESRSHGRVIPRADFKHGAERWRAWEMLGGDPCFNPNLSYKSAYPLFNRGSGDDPDALNRRLMARLPQKELLQLPDDIR